MKKCKNCGDGIRNFVENEDKKRIDCRAREYCIKCNPIGERKFWRGKATNKTLGIGRNNKVKRQCPICKKEHFTTNRSPICYSCKNKKIRLERKIKAYEILGNKCKVCEYNKCANALDIHHREEYGKTLTFADSWGLSWKKLEKELEKCILLCCRCHREFHDGLIVL